MLSMTQQETRLVIKEIIQDTFQAVPHILKSKALWPDETNHLLQAYHNLKTLMDKMNWNDINWYNFTEYGVKKD